MIHRGLTYPYALTAIRPASLLKPCDDHAKARQVRCIETGVVYDTMAEAAKAHDMKGGSVRISNAITMQHSAGGYHWELG